MAINIARQVERKLIAGIILLGVLVTALLWGVTLYSLHRDQQATVRTQQRELEALGRAIEQHTSHSFAAIDAMLRHLARLYVDEPQKFPALVPHIISHPPVKLQQLAVIGPDGWLAYSSLESAGPMNLGDRQHFRVHLENPDTGMFISQPVMGRVSKKWSIQFTRRIAGPDGSFRGVMVASVHPDEFSDYFNALEIPQGSAIGLIGQDRVVRARVSNPPLPDSPAGKVVPGQLDYFTNPSQTSGIKLLTGTFDGVPRLIAYRQTSPYPMLVTVSHSMQHIVRDYEQRRLVACWLMGLITVALTAACALLVWLVRRQTQAQAQLEQSRQSLAVQADELARSNAELESFAYVASHDLREPLRMVTSYLRLIERRLGDRLEPDIEDFIGFAVAGAERMDRLILDLLEYARVGRSRQVPELLRPDDLLRACASLFRETLEEVNGEIILPDEPLPALYGQRDELLRLFQNLIGNALKYRHPDRAPLVCISARQQGPTVVFAVADNGIGIETQYFDRIFVIFQRLHGRGVYEGTGIGLALCKKIVHQHRGQIWLTSVPGQGSTFFVELPLSTLSPAEGTGGAAEKNHFDEKSL